jgi:hypothetical protein
MGVLDEMYLFFYEYLLSFCDLNFHRIFTHLHFYFESILSQSASVVFTPQGAVSHHWKHCPCASLLHQITPSPPTSTPTPPRARSPARTRIPTRTRIPADMVQLLLEWAFFYSMDVPRLPSADEKLYLMGRTRLSRSQLDNWFQNLKRGNRYQKEIRALAMR